MSDTKTGPQSVSTPLYTHGDYDRELNYKLWSTYKARFNASERLKAKANLSKYALALLSAYLIMFSLVVTMIPFQDSKENEQVLLFVNISISIIILVINLIESGKDFAVRAYKYHQNGLDGSELYNQLRIQKTKLKEEHSGKFLKEVERITEEYGRILQRSENHENIDNLMFRASKPDYEDHKLKDRDILKIRIRYYVFEYGYYWMAIIVPPALFAYYIIGVWSPPE